MSSVGHAVVMLFFQMNHVLPSNTYQVDGIDCVVTWMWKSNKNPFDSKQLKEWTAFPPDISAKIEQAYSQEGKSYSDILCHSHPFRTIPMHSDPFPSIPIHSQPFEWFRMRFLPLGPTGGTHRRERVNYDNNLDQCSSCLWVVLQYSDYLLRLSIKQKYVKKRN